MTREEAFQEFWDNAMYPSLKPNISEAAKAVAMAALKQPERVHGRWIVLDDCANEGVYCSECHKTVYKVDYARSNKPVKMKSNFCPNCGAIMDEEK